MLLKPLPTYAPIPVGTKRTITEFVFWATSLDDGTRVCLETVLCDQELRESPLFEGAIHFGNYPHWVTIRRYRIPNAARD